MGEVLSGGAAMPVLNDHSESVIFTEPEGHLAYRYWNDVTHPEHERNFSNPHELNMASFHLWDAEQRRLPSGLD